MTVHQAPAPARLARLAEAERLFGVRSQGELDELVWRFRSIVHTLQAWEERENQARV